jgi:hypothetical protein
VRPIHCATEKNGGVRTPGDRPLPKIWALYQAQIIKATPPPRFTIAVRFEDFVLEQERTLKRLERFLGFSLGRIIVNPDPVGRWARQTDPRTDSAVPAGCAAAVRLRLIACSRRRSGTGVAPAKRIADS